MSNIRSETNTDTSLAWMSSVLGMRVTPQQFAHDTFLRRFSNSVNLSDVIELNAVFAEETTVGNHDLLAQNVDQRKAAEDITEDVVGLGVVLVEDFSFETMTNYSEFAKRDHLPVKLIHALSLVVSSSEVHAVGVEGLPSQKANDNFN